MFVAMNWTLVEPVERDRRAEMHRRELEFSMKAEPDDDRTHRTSGDSVAHLGLPAPRSGVRARVADQALVDS
jgi:hypothetical protein